MASSSELDLLLTIGITIFAALGFSTLFSKLKQPVVIGQLLAGMIGLATLASFLAASFGLHFLGPRPTAQPAMSHLCPIETPLDPGVLIPAQEDGGLA